MTVPGAAPGRSTSKIAWWKLWSKRSPFGSMRFSPWRSKAASNSRSVAATPSSRLFARESKTSASGTLSSARRRLSTEESRSRAKLLIAYFWVSSRSRWARRRTFSVSASARSSRSLVSASSASSCTTARSSGDGPAAPSSGNSPESLAGAIAGAPSSLSSIMSLSDKPPDHLGGVVHHRDDAGIVDPGGADDPDRADDLLAAVLIRRDDHRTAGDAEQVAFGADKDLHPVGLLAGVEQAQHGLLRLQHLEQRPQPLEIGKRGDVFEQMGMAAHDQRALAVAAGPAGDAGRHDARGQLVEL